MLSNQLIDLNYNVQKERCVIICSFSRYDSFTECICSVEKAQGYIIKAYEWVPENVVYTIDENGQQFIWKLEYE